MKLFDVIIKFFSKGKVQLTLFLVTFSLNLFAQTGLEFWATAPYSTLSHDGNHTIHVVVSSMASPATVTLSIPANPGFTPITINLPANSTDYFDFNALMLPKVELSEWDQITNKGILIQSTDMITSYLEVFSTFNTDIFALKGKNALGTDFYTPFETNWGNHNFGCTASNTNCIQAYSHAEIVATDNNTTITITPTVDVYKSPSGIHPAGIPYTVVLNKGQTYTVRANDITTIAQPAGTHITSDKPISVTITDDSMEIGGAFDIVGDQLTPVSIEGSQYIAMKGYLNDEYVYGVASQNTTKISVNGVVRSKTYNKGDTIIIKLTSNTTVIQSDNKQPFNIFHVSGNGGEAGGAILPPTDQCTGSMQVGFNFGHADNGDYLYLNLMVRTGAESNFLVDGATASWLTPASFAPVAGTSWSVARFSLTNANLAKGNHLISNTKDLFHMGFINYTGPGAMYGYFSDFENMVVSVVAIKSNTDTVVDCTGEPLQLRVNGGVNYLWSGVNTATNTDASGYLSSKTIYNPIISGTIPPGNYLYTVSVTSACNGPAVSKTVKVKVVQSPTGQNKTVNICESAIGSSCASSIDLSSYTSLMVNNWSTGFVAEWQKDAYNLMVPLDDYNGIRRVNYGTQNARVFDMAASNPLPSSSINSSSTVLKFEVGGGSNGIITLNNQANYPFDLNNGAVFSMKVMDSVRSSWSANAYRSVSMKLKNGTDSATVTVNLSKYSKWEQLTFDFTSFPPKVYNTMVIILNGKDYEQDVFFVDDIQKQFSYQKIKIPTPTSANICNPEKIYALVEDANGCSANSVLTPTIVAGSFAVGNPTINLCQTGLKAGEATGVNFSSYTSNITNNVAGLSIIDWDKTYTNYDSVFENFDNVTGKIAWNTPTPIGASGNSTINIVKPINNANSPIKNTSGKTASIFYGSGTGYSISTDLANTIDLSQGWLFNLLVSYWTGQWSNGSSTHTMSMTLSGSSGSVTVGPINIHHTSSNNQGTSDSNHIWNNVVFDFTAYKTQKGFDRITINFNTSNWASDTLYFDNFHRTMQPFLAKTTPSNQTVQNGDKAYAIVKDASGCLVKSTLTFSVKDCGPPAIDQIDTMCEASLGSGNVTAINLINYNNAIKGNVTANTVNWYSNVALTSVVATPTNVTVTNGLTFYALVKDPSNGKQDTATLMFTIKSLPNIVFPTINGVCEGSSAFTITGMTPIGGTYSGGTYISSGGVFDPTKATVGAANTVTYSVTVNGCSSTKNTTATVNANPTPSLTTATKDLFYCGTAGVTITISNNTGATYNWTKNGIAITGTTNVQMAMTSGTYTVTATLNGCSKSVTDIVVSGHTIPSYIITGGGKYCDDTTKPGITITQTQGETPWSVYYKNGTNKYSQIGITASSIIIPATNLAPGTYTLDSLINTYCKASVSTALVAILTEVKRPTSLLQTTDLDYCGIYSNVTLTVAPFTPGSYQWKQAGTNVGSNSNSYANAVAGTYSVVLTNDICQYTVSNIVVTAYAKPTYTFSGGGTFCAGKTVSPVILSLAGKAPWSLTYRIDGTDYPVIVTTTPYTVPQTINGTYDLKSLTDANTCIGDITTNSASITIKSLPTVTFTYVDSICQTTPTIDLSTKVSPKTGGTGVYSGTGVNASTGLFTHSGSNTYTINYTFTTTNGCVDSAKRTIKINPNPTASISPKPATICASSNLLLDGNAASGTTPYTHLWSDPSGVTITAKTSPTITINTPTSGSYLVTYTVTDKNGCTGSDNITVKVNGLPSITATALPSVICNGVSSTISAAGATSYVWNPLSGSVSPSTTTKYYVTGTDANGCVNTANVSLIVNNLPTVVATASMPTVCIGKSTTVSATGANTYVWSPASGTVTPASSTVYYVTGTDGNNCKATSSIAISVINLPTVVATATPATICIGKFTTVAASGTDTYTWSQVAGLVSPTSTTTYFVTGTMNSGCLNTEKVTVTINQLPTILASASPNVICNGFSSTLNATGGVSYLWSTVSGIVTPTSTSNYFVTGTDINGCINTASITVKVNQLPTVNASASFSTICLGKSTTISATGASSYIWSPTPGTVSPTVSTTYFVTGTDINNCIRTSSVNVTVNSLPTVTWSALNSHLVCSKGNVVNLNITADPLGGIGVFGSTIGLSKATETSATFNPTTSGAGTKTLKLDYTYTDLNGCISSAPQDTIMIFDTPEPTSELITTISTPIPSLFQFNVTSKNYQNVNWYSSIGGSSIGTGNTYIPVIPHSNTTPDSLKAGIYHYWLTQTIYGCESQSIIVDAVVNDCPAKAPNAGSDPHPCVSTGSGKSISATALGSGLLHWFNGSNTATNLELGTGNTYTVTETDPKTYYFYVAEWDIAKSCFGPATQVPITIHALPSPVITASKLTACNTDNAFAINVNPALGSGKSSVLNCINPTMLNGTTFNPNGAGEISGSYTLTYTYTDTYNCMNTTSTTINVHYTPPPIGQKDTNILKLTLATSTVKVTASGTALQWYYDSKVQSAIPLATISPLDTKMDTTGVSSSLSKSQTFYVTQKLNGCESKPDSIKVTIVDCPWKTPSVTKIGKCENDPLLSISSLKATTTESTPTWQWYTDANTTILASTTSGATSDTFIPGTVVPGVSNYYVRFSQIEPKSGNACWSPAAKAVYTVFAKPSPTIIPSTITVCNTSPPVAITLNPLINGNSTLVCSIPSMLSGQTFNPNGMGDTTGIYTLTYTYTDANNCTNTTYSSISVQYTHPPVAQNDTNILKVTLVNSTVKINATGTSLQWYYNYKLKSAIPSGNTALLDTHMDTTGVTNTNPKVEKFFVTQTIAGCESLPDSVTVTIPSCPWLAPTVNGDAFCKDDIKATTTPLIASTLNKSITWQWYDASKTPIASTTSTSYTPSSLTTSTYYVNYKKVEPTSNTACWSPLTAVIRTINPLPTVTLTNTITHLCIDNTAIPIITSSNTSGNGIFSEAYLTNVTNTKADFEPKNAGVGSHTIHYTFTDGNGCVSSANQTIVVDSTPAPVVVPLFEDMVHNSKPTMMATGISIKWYSSVTLGVAIGSGNSFVDPTFGENDIITKDYWVTQTMNGCESKPSTTKVKIDACPVPVATVDKNNFNRCIYDNSPIITAISGINWSMSPSNRRTYYWYSSISASNPVFIGNPFNPAVNGQIGAQTYYVAEYDSLYTCFGSRSKVSFTIVPVPAPAVTSVNDICSGDFNQTFNINLPNSNNKYFWYGTADTLQGILASGVSFTSRDETVGTHNYWAATTDLNSCHSITTPVSMTIKPRPNRPTVANDSTCKNEPFKTLTASGNSSSLFEWYKTDSLHWLATSQTYNPVITSTTTFYVRENLNNCRGWFTPVTYTINPIPVAPIVTNVSICENQSIPSFNVNAIGSIKWYNQSQTFIDSSNLFTPTTKVSSDFFVTQTIKGCEGVKATVRFQVNPLPNKPILKDGVHMCENSGNPSVKVVSGTNIKWYDSADTSKVPVSNVQSSYIYQNKPVGEYHIFATQTDAFNCQSVTSEAISFIDSVPIKPIINEKPIAVCSYDVIPTFTCTNNNSIDWYLNGMKISTGSSLTLNPIQIREGETKSIKVKVSTPAPGTCISQISDAVTLKMKNTPSVPKFTMEDVCTDESCRILFNRKTGIFTITDVSTNQSWTTDSILTIPASQNTIAGNKIFTFYQTIDGCDSKLITDSFTIRNRPNPQIIGQDKLCERSLRIPYRVTLTNKTNTFNWSITGNRVLYKSSQSAQGNTCNVDYFESGLDTLIVYENNGYCIGTGILPIEVAPSPEPDFTWEIPGGLTKVSFVNISTQSDIIGKGKTDSISLQSFRWNFKQESDTRDSVQSLESFENGDVFKIQYNYGEHEAKLIAINSFGCKDSITKKFFVDIAEGLFVPNSFIPEHASSMLNKFQPKGFNLESYKIWIYDTWGNLIWYSDKLIGGSPAEGWDGKDKNGEIMKLDSYIWKIDATFKDGKEWDYKNNNHHTKFGNVLLLR